MQLDRSRLVGILLAVGAAGAVLLLWPEREETPEAVIREKVERMADAASQRDLGFVMEQIAEGFRSSRGADKQQIKSVLAAQMFRGELVQVWPVDLEVTLESDAVAQLAGKFVFARKEAADVRTAVAAGGVTAYRIDGRLEKAADGEWRFVSAEYESISAAELF